MNEPQQSDCIILGGGVCGLWLRAALAHAGFRVVLISADPLGTDQTIASQGILHRGVKYALSPAAANASATLAKAAAFWQEALAGAGPIDLQSVRTLTRTMHMWTRPGLLAAMTGTAASLAMRSEVVRLAHQEFPPAFAGAPDRTAVWAVQETCVETTTLLRALSDQPAGPLVVTQPPHPRPRIEQTADLTLVHAGGRVYSAPCALCCAGNGNFDLLADLGADAGAICQRRPLHMVLMRGAPFELFGHCMQELSDKPRLTITSFTEPGGEIVWYIGGDLAETGLQRTSEGQIKAARAEIAACLPWADISRARFATLQVSRAEGRTPDGRRPDGPILREFGRVAAIWPTKLALAPVASELAIRFARGVADSRRSGPWPTQTPSAAPIAPAPWNRNDLTWT